MQSPKLVNGDLVIENGQLVMIDGAEELAQCVEIVLGTNKGEWFLNPELGIDFHKFIGKNLSAEARREQIRQGIRQVDRIKTIESIEISDDPKERTSTIQFKATGTDGTTVSREVTINAG